MTEVGARSFTLAALVQIGSALDDASDVDDFFSAVDAIANGEQNTLALPFDTGAPSALIAGTARDTARDVDNGPKVYEYLGVIDRANASDRRLWTYLALVTYRSYMSERWPLSSSDNGWKDRVRSRWLLGSATRGNLIRHGIARLWWISELTHDPKCRHTLSRQSSDPFAYTKAVLQNEDRVLALFDRELGAVGKVARTVLEHANQKREYAKGTHVRDLMRDLTLVYSYRDLSLLNEKQLAQFIADMTGAASTAEQA